MPPSPFTFTARDKNSVLNFVLSEFNMLGEFVGFATADKGLLQLCKTSDWILNAAFTFGRAYRQQCRLNSQSLLRACEKADVRFYDIFLEIAQESSRSQLYAVPILNLNFQSGSTKKNKLTSDQWTLTRRFFMVDCLTSKDAAEAKPRIIRYAKHISFNIELQHSRDGKIFPPRMNIEYGEVRQEDLEKEKSVEVEFFMNYRMDTQRHEKDIEITMGVLCPLGALWAALRTWSWFQRSGRGGQLDHVAIQNFLVYLAASIANVFFVVILGTSLWLLVLYKKQQAVVTMLLTADQEYSFLVYAGMATALKCVEVIHLVLQQISVHVFFIDWERPRGFVIPRNGESLAEAQSGTKQQTPAPINIWRTYMIANEWNELHTKRKCSPTLQLFVMILLLEVLNLKALALVEPDIALRNSNPEEFQDTRMSRFAVAAGLYLFVGLIQWFLAVVIVERCIADPFHSFNDLCSMSNVSVFVMMQQRFGYYIHGRSVHGHADTNMREMNEFLQREREDLCSKRGLEPNTDNQCFRMLLPLEFRFHYDKLRSGATPSPQQARMTSADPSTLRMESVIHVYEQMNIYLSSFIDHTWPGIDYIVKNRTFFECIFDMELQDAASPLNQTNKGAFYNDPSEQAYVEAFFYGHEFTLLTFDLLVFCATDLIAKDFLVAAAVTYFVSTAVRRFRAAGGRRNIVQKGLVDQRFLI